MSIRRQPAGWLGPTARFGRATPAAPAAGVTIAPAAIATCDPCGRI